MNSHSLELVPPGGNGGGIARIGEQSPAAADRLDLSESVTFIRRRLMLIAGIVALTLAAGLLISLLSTKTYRAEATVMVEQQSNVVDQTATTATAPPEISGEMLETQLQIIQSREMASAVARKLGLDKGMGDAQRRELLDTMQKNVKAARSGESFALTISYDDSDPHMAARIANTYASTFANWRVGVDQARNDEARKEVAARLAELRTQAQNDTQSLQQYRIANNLLSTTGASQTEQELSDYSVEVAKARAQAAEDQARLNTALSQLRSGSNGDDVGEALDSPVISSLRTQEATLAAKVGSLSSSYGPNYPALIDAKDQLKQVRASIQAEISRVVSNLRARSEVSQQRLASLNGSLNGARNKLANNNEAMVGLSALQRTAEASQAIYETYLNRYKQLLAAEGTEKPNARILTSAVPPLKARTPNLKLNLALALVIGLGLGIVVAYIAEALFQGITSADDVRKDLGETFLTSIPLMQSVDRQNSNAVQTVREDPRSAFTESFHNLAVSIDQAARGHSQVIAITSALPGEGKTLMSCCLAHVLAQGGERTVLIDCDYQRRGITKLLDVRPEQKGLIEILDGSATFDVDQMVHNLSFCVVPLQRGDGGDEHLLAGQEFIDLLDELRGKFDRIVLDLPPILPMAVTRTIASRADAVVLALRWRKTSKFAFRAARSRLPDDLVNVVGVALNQVDLRRRGYFDPNDVAYYYNRYKDYAA
ncbi:Wzz/FepE/Etk N-terminal domain-containing protein [Novosphingobium sp. ZN18A2]|uniref:GumC family protein n=1 Tax=Novosphingobium sp. ZN18A2 TaxID=3079861 RepID=UPI0030CCF32F